MHAMASMASVGSRDLAFDVLLIGGGVASVRCARTLRREGFAGSILLVGDEPSLPYNRPPLSKELLREDLPDELALAEPATWYARRGIDLWTDAEVTSLDPDARVAVAADGRRIRFERCLLATGASPRTLPIPGGDGTLELRTLADSRRLGRAARDAGRDAPVVVVGGGLIGVEVASTLRALGLRPTIVEASGALWGGRLGSTLAAWGSRRLRGAGVEVRLGEPATAVGRGFVEAGAARLAAAFVVAGIGVVPREELARSAGIEVRDGILTDADHRTTHPAAWAAGDVARVAGRRDEHWHAAREGGEAAARSMLGLPPRPRPAAWTFTEVAGVALDVVGDPDLGEDEEWLVPDRVLASVASGRVVALAAVGSALDAAAMRDAVGRGVTVADARRLAAGPA